MMGIIPPSLHTLHFLRTFGRRAGPAGSDLLYQPHLSLGAEQSPSPGAGVGTPSQAARLCDARGLAEGRRNGATFIRYPQVYAGLGVLGWFIPRKEFHNYLRRLVEAGFADRLMFGSNQMIWPESIEVTIKGIESANYLTAQQKRDIFYNNAARFLRLDR